MFYCFCACGVQNLKNAENTSVLESGNHTACLFPASTQFWDSMADIGSGVYWIMEVQNKLEQKSETTFAYPSFNPGIHAEICCLHRS